MIARHPFLIGTALAAGVAACTHSPRGFRDEGARPITPAHYRAQRMRVEAGQGTGYYLADSATRDVGSLFGGRRIFAVIDVGYANPLLSVRRFGYTEEDGGDVERPFGWHDRASGDACDRDKPQLCVRDSLPQWAIQFNLPVAFHLLWDPFSPNAPIVDTDYEFGGEIAFRRTMPNRQELLASAYWGHISTHIGDEYTIAARSDYTRAPFPRINVSYEPWRLALGHRVNGPAGDTTYGEHPRWRLDVVADVEGSCLPGLCGDNPYYNTELSENHNYLVPATNEGVEPSLTLSYHRTRKIRLDSVRAKYERRIPGTKFGSVMFGARRVFPYRPDLGPASRPVIPSDYQFMVNAVAGVEFQRPTRRTLPTAWYLRYYRGPNPYGQLRNERRFWLASTGLTLSR
jgi:hypothetical protein